MLSNVSNMQLEFTLSITLCTNNAEFTLSFVAPADEYDTASPPPACLWGSSSELFLSAQPLLLPVLFIGLPLRCNERWLAEIMVMLMILFSFRLLAPCQTFRNNLLRLTPSLPPFWLTGQDMTFSVLLNHGHALQLTRLSFCDNDN